MRREKLLEVAFYKFAEKGYNTTLSEIADGAGIKKQSIYNHFKSKDDLLYETIKNEIHNFYSIKSEEFASYRGLGVEDSFKSMFFSICNYYKDINKLKFWRWILLIESKELFTKTRDLIRQNESKFYTNTKNILQNEIKNSAISDQEIWGAIQTFVVMVHGVLDSMLLYRDVFESEILIQNTWNFYWSSLSNIIKK